MVNILEVMSCQLLIRARSFSTLMSDAKFNENTVV